MAINGAREPLLTQLPDPAAHETNRQVSRKRFLRCRSAPLANIDPPEKTDRGSIRRSESIFEKLHPSFRNVAIYLVGYLSIGAVIFYLVRHQITGKKTDGVLDAIYFTIVTMTTVGYGDLVPNSDLTKLLACAFVFTGMALVGLILSKAADFLVEKQEVLIIKALHRNRKSGPSQILKEVEVNKTWYKFFVVFFLLLAIIVTGTIFLVTVEKLDVIDAFYCVCSTITTLGYGDKSFSSEGGRVFAVFWILTGTICLGQLFLYIAELNTEKRQKEITEMVLTRRTTNADLEAADLDHDGNVGLVHYSSNS